MKKFGLFATLGLATLALAGCNFNCNCETTDDEDAILNQRIEYCNAHGGTHSFIHSPTAAYGECAFPSGITCEDTMIEAGDCDYEPNLESIDTEEKRLNGCEENVQGRMANYMEDAKYVYTQWGEESEGGAIFVRNGIVKYTRDGANYTMNAECIADFVDGSLSVSYGDEIAAENIEIYENNENEEENIEENIEIDEENLELDEEDLDYQEFNE